MTAWLGQKDTDFIDRSASACTHPCKPKPPFVLFLIEEEKQCFLKYAKIDIVSESAKGSLLAGDL